MKRFIIIPLAVIFQITFGSIFISWCYTLKIDYKEVLTPIFEKKSDRVSWLFNSADGSRLSFTTAMEDGIALKNRLYVMNPDGTNLKDLTSKLVVTDLGPIEVWRLSDLQLNKSGSRLFFRAEFDAGTRIYIFDIDKGELLPFYVALNSLDFDIRKSFGINAKGNRIYFKHNAFIDETWKRGFYKCTVPDNLFEPQACVQYMDLDQLPGFQLFGFCRFLGHSIDADTTLFSWNSNPFISGQDSLWVIDDTGLYPGPINFIPKKVTSSFEWIWPTTMAPGALPNEIISADGRLALAYIDYPEDIPSKLFVVNLKSEAEKPALFKFMIEVVSRLEYPHLSPSGRYARFTCGDYNSTIYNLLTDEKRDTLSELLGFGGGITTVSNITEDDRYYFLSRNLWDPRGFNVAQIYKVDMAPTDFDNSPNITDVNFINRGLRSDGNTNVTITAYVSDAQGDNTIQWVKLMGLLNGIERSGNSTGPFNFSQEFNDDGRDGDVTPGDGIYTNSSVVAVKEYFQDFAGPIKIGIRIVAKDDEGNFTIIDSVIREKKAMSWIQLLLLDD